MRLLKHSLVFLMLTKDIDESKKAHNESCEGVALNLVYIFKGTLEIARLIVSLYWKQ